jgi:hypothetical protein
MYSAVEWKVVPKFRRNRMANEFDSGNPVAPQQDVAARPPVAPDMGSGVSEGTTGTITPPAAQPVLPRGTQINTDPNAVPGSAEPHHGLLASIFQDLAGGKRTEFRQTDSGPVPVKVNLKPGEMAQSILSAALVGLSGGLKTHGGPGGNKGQAFTAGFEAEEKQRTGQEEGKKEAAQKEFQNKNVADEMTLRKAANARDQQRSIDLAQEHSMHMEQAKQALEQGKFEFAQRTTEFEQRQADRMNLLRTLGATPLTYPDGKPVEEFNSPEEAAAWANKNSALAIQSGKYNTVFEVDPVTNRYVIMQKPKSWDDPQWLGVKVDPKTNLPVKDKDGQMIPDGSFKNTNGKVEVPAGQMTPHQLYDSQTRLLDLRNKELSREEALERLRNMKRERIKDEQQQKADDEYNRAGGNPDAIDEKTGNFIVSPSSRTILQQRFIKEAAMEGTILNAAQKEMDRVGQPGASATDEEKREYEGMKQQADQARDNLRQLQINMGLLARTPNVADVMVNNVRKQFTNDAGVLDEQAALASVEKITAPSAIKQQIRQKLSAEPPNRPPEQLDAVIKGLEGYSKEDQIRHINTAPLSKADKQSLIQRINSEPDSNQNVVIILSDGSKAAMPIQKAVEEGLPYQATIAPESQKAYDTYWNSIRKKQKQEAEESQQSQPIA